MNKVIQIEKRPVTIDQDYQSLLFSHIWYWTTNGYLVTHLDGSLVFFHNFVLPIAHGLFVHHKDGDKGNNTRKNLVYQTPQECQLRVERFGGRLYYGVKRVGSRYEASYKLKDKKYVIGRYENIARACVHFDYMMMRLFKGFTPLNYPEFPWVLTEQAK